MREVPEGFNPITRQNLTINGRPTQMPTLSEGSMLVCEFIRAPEIPSFNKVYLCDSVEDMQHLYDAYYKGAALQLNWYITTELAKILSSEETAEWLSGNK